MRLYLDTKRTLLLSMVILVVVILGVCVALAVATDQQAEAQREFIAMLGNTSAR